MARWSLSFAVAMVAAGTLAAQELPSKIGFVDVERAVATIEEGKARLSELREWARPREEDLARLSREIEALRSEIATKRATVSEDSLAELNRKLVARQREFEDAQRVARRDFEERQEVILRDVGQKLSAVINEYADKQRFTAVFILRPNDLLYLASSADLTDTVIKLYNERYPFTAGKR